MFRHVVWYEDLTAASPLKGTPPIFVQAPVGVGAEEQTAGYLRILIVGKEPKWER